MSNPQQELRSNNTKVRSIDPLIQDISLTLMIYFLLDLMQHEFADNTSRLAVDSAASDLLISLRTMTRRQINHLHSGLTCNQYLKSKGSEVGRRRQ